MVVSLYKDRPVNGCRECKGTGIALYKLAQAGARRDWGKLCERCGTEWRLRAGKVSVFVHR